MKYPIYIPSKGRASNQITMRLLEKNKVENYFVVVEASEFNSYLNYVDKNHLLKLPNSDYGTSSVARNFCISHSKKLGFKKHWQIDDDFPNIYEHKKGVKLNTPLKKILENVENKVECLPEVKIAGINTSASFLVSVDKDYNYNCSLAGCYLISNDKFRFRLQMLVDMDYQLQILNAGYSTIKFQNYAFSFIPTLKQKGGYYDIYSQKQKRLQAINDFLSLNPNIEPGIKQLPSGMYVCKNISKVWRLTKKNNLQELMKKLPNPKKKQIAEKSKKAPLEKFKPSNHWKGMPEFTQNNLTAFQKIIIHFEKPEDVVKFSKLLGRAITENTRSIWYPEVGEDKYMNKRYADTKK